MSVLSRLRGEHRIDAERLAARIDAIDRFIKVVD